MQAIYCGYHGSTPSHTKLMTGIRILPPRCPHAVYTPEDCLAVTGHFYTAAHLGSSLRGLQLQEEYPEISNEDLKPEFYELLNRIFATFEDICKNHGHVRDAVYPYDIQVATSFYFHGLDVARGTLRRYSGGLQRAPCMLSDTILRACQKLAKTLKIRKERDLEARAREKRAFQAKANEQEEEEDVDMDDKEDLEEASGDEDSSDAE